MSLKSEQRVTFHNRSTVCVCVYIMCDLFFFSFSIFPQSFSSTHSMRLFVSEHMKCAHQTTVTINNEFYQMSSVWTNTDTQINFESCWARCCRRLYNIHSHVRCVAFLLLLCYCLFLLLIQCVSHRVDETLFMRYK